MKKVRTLGIILLAMLFIFGLAACGGKEEKKSGWPETGMGAMLPEPSSGKVEISIDDENYFSAAVKDGEDDLYETYVSACKDKGFSVESEKDTYSYDAFNEEGYHLSVMDLSNDLMITLDAPKAMKEYRWPGSDIAKLIPKPESEKGNMEWEHEDSFLLYVGDTDIDAFHDYVDKCAEAGFTVDYSRGDTFYYANNKDGYSLSLKYEGFKTMSIRISSPDEDEEEEPEPETTTAAEKKEKKKDKKSDVNDGDIRPEIKEAIDSYEAFVDEYVEFANNYDSSDLSMLTKYFEMLSKEVEMSAKFTGIEDEGLTTAESAYYAEVSLRCSQKMLEAASKLTE